MTDWRLVELILVAVVAAVAVPSLIQLYLTLRNTRRTLDELRPKVEMAVAGLSEIIVRVQKLSVALEADRRLPLFLQSVEDLANGVEEVKKGIVLVSTVGSTIGPAFMAGVRSMQTTLAEHPAGARASPEAPIGSMEPLDRPVRLPAPVPRETLAARMR